MTELNLEHSLRLALLGLMVGSVSLYGWRVGQKMVRSPEEFRRMLVKKGSAHPGLLWNQPGGRESIRLWGTVFSKLTFVYAVFSFVIAGLMFALIVMDHFGMNATVGPIAEFLSKFEAGLIS